MNVVVFDYQTNAYQWQHTLINGSLLDRETQGKGHSIARYAGVAAMNNYAKRALTFGKSKTPHTASLSLNAQVAA